MVWPQGFLFADRYRQKNSITFVCKGERRESRPLKEDEVNTIKKMLMELTVPFVVKPTDPYSLILPTIPTALSIKTNYSNTTIEWTNSDLAQSPAAFSKLEEFVEFISELIEISTEGIDFPVYL